MRKGAYVSNVADERQVGEAKSRRASDASGSWTTYGRFCNEGRAAGLLALIEAV